MMQQSSTPVLELRRLLFELKDFRPDVGVRFKLIGQTWQTNFSKVIKLTETGAILLDEKVERPYLLPDLIIVMQFELNAPFQQYEPYKQYTISPSAQI